MDERHPDSLQAEFDENYAVKLLELCRQTICLISFPKGLEFSLLLRTFARITIKQQFQHETKSLPGIKTHRDSPSDLYNSILT